MKKVGATQFTAAARLSSGLRINSAADDAAGLAISEKMRGQIRGLDMASKNAQDAISLVQTAEGGMQEITNMIQRIRELTVQAANDTNVSLDKLNISKEVGQLANEIQTMAQRVEFNTRNLLSGSFSGGGLHMQIGANSGQSLDITISGVGSVEVCLAGLEGAVSATTSGSVLSPYIKSIDSGLTVVSQARALLGAFENRLNYTIKSLDISSQNLAASESRIRDADMGKEMMNLTKANVLQQAATSMLAQGNQNPQMILQLLR
jgi:flagellin